MEEKKEWNKDNIKGHERYDDFLHLWNTGYRFGVKVGALKLFIVEAILYAAWYFYNL